MFLRPPAASTKQSMSTANTLQVPKITSLAFDTRNALISYLRIYSLIPLLIAVSRWAQATSPTSPTSPSQSQSQSQSQSHGDTRFLLSYTGNNLPWRYSCSRTVTDSYPLENLTSLSSSTLVLVACYMSLAAEGLSFIQLDLATRSHPSFTLNSGATPYSALYS
jgi:hypothetical protein